MSQKTEVLYNASCPICSREVNTYARLSAKAALPITYDDLDDPEKLACWGVDKEEAAKRFHVRKNGQIFSGIDAFIILWAEIPQTKWLSRLINLPGIHFAAETTYDWVLAPILYKFHIKRQKHRTPAS
jgi:predicted DCC family thiol-disulfide oxidoreductase YuxK